MTPRLVPWLATNSQKFWNIQNAHIWSSSDEPQLVNGKSLLLLDLEIEELSSFSNRGTLFSCRSNWIAVHSLSRRTVLLLTLLPDCRREPVESTLFIFVQESLAKNLVSSTELPLVRSHFSEWSSMELLHSNVLKFLSEPFHAWRNPKLRSIVRSKVIYLVCESDYSMWIQWSNKAS